MRLEPDRRPEGGIHVTDVTNASRTLLMDLETLDWDPGILSLMGIPRAMLPAIRSSSEVYATAVGDLAGVPVAGDLGDQQAALFGQACFSPGEAKNTYGTGCFLLLNTGATAVPSRERPAHDRGLQARQRSRPSYALEGSVAIAGALVQWLRDNLGLIEKSADVEALAASVADNGGVYFVPAFSGLFAPYWRSDARGVIVRPHRLRQPRPPGASRPGGHRLADPRGPRRHERRLGRSAHGRSRSTAAWSRNDLLMQFQADVLDVPVIRPACHRDDGPRRGLRRRPGSRVLGTASTSCAPTGPQDRTWEPAMDAAVRDREYARWKKAVRRTFDSAEEPPLPG